MTDYDDLISETLGEMVETEEALLAIHLSDRFKAKLEELERCREVLKEIYRWAEPMREGPRDCVPDWFYKVRGILYKTQGDQIAKRLEEECP